MNVIVEHTVQPTTVMPNILFFFFFFSVKIEYKKASEFTEGSKVVIS